MGLFLYLKHAFERPMPTFSKGVLWAGHTLPPLPARQHLQPPFRHPYRDLIGTLSRPYRDLNKTPLPTSSEPDTTPIYTRQVPPPNLPLTRDMPSLRLTLPPKKSCGSANPSFPLNPSNPINPGSDESFTFAS